MTKREIKKVECPSKITKTIRVSYEGYTICAPGSIEVVSVNELDWDLMFSRYISQRKPCVIEGVVPGLNVNSFQPDLLSELFQYDGKLEVERKIDGGFGSNVQRLKMRFEELMENLRTGRGDFYLTTQYGEGEEGEDDDDEEEEGVDEESEGFADNCDSETSSLANLSSSLHDDFEDFEDVEEPRVFIQPPLCNLSASVLPSSPSFLDKLVIQQVNLWLGSARPSLLSLDSMKPDLGVGKWIPNGTSSGLHHDHADNLYIPIHGRKCFTLFSPQDAPNLYTQGDIGIIYKNGVVDYVPNKNAPSWRHIRDDGAVVSEVNRWKLEQQSTLSETERKSLLEQITDEDKLLTSLSSLTTSEPPSFSKVPPVLLHIQEVEPIEDRARLQELSQKCYPLLSRCQSMVVDLKPGQMLYLPAGWFHEVKSYGEESPEFPYLHEAINYWFEPPNGPTSSRPYKDDYWSEISRLTN